MSVELSADYFIPVCKKHGLTRTPRRITVPMTDEWVAKRVQCSHQSCAEDSTHFVIMEVEA